MLILALAGALAGETPMQVVQPTFVTGTRAGESSAWAAVDGDPDTSWSPSIKDSIELAYPDMTGVAGVQLFVLTACVGEPSLTGNGRVSSLDVYATSGFDYPRRTWLLEDVPGWQSLRVPFDLTLKPPDSPVQTRVSLHVSGLVPGTLPGACVAEVRMEVPATAVVLPPPVDPSFGGGTWFAESSTFDQTRFAAAARAVKLRERTLPKGDLVVLRTPPVRDDAVTDALQAAAFPFKDLRPLLDARTFTLAENGAPAAPTTYAVNDFETVSVTISRARVAWNADHTYPLALAVTIARTGTWKDPDGPADAQGMLLHETEQRYVVLYDPTTHVASEAFVRTRYLNVAETPYEAGWESTLQVEHDAQARIVAFSADIRSLPEDDAPGSGTARAATR